MNNKRKNRGGSVRTQRQRSIVTEGVYSNAVFMHAATSQVGNVARIMTASGQVWEGVFKTYSQNFDVALEVVTRVENPDGPDCRLLTETHQDRLIFKPCDILSMTFKNVDLDYPVKDTFQTDTAISARLNGSKSEEKELEPWDAGQLNGNDVSLDLDASNGWDVQDMFRKNEQEYGVQSTFDHSLRGYTVPLQTSDTADYKEAAAKAEQIASEIESQPAYKARLELENGDEEAAFASVVRPTQNPQEASNGKYIPPAKRKGQNNGKLVRSTPPPSSGSSSQNSPSPKETRPPVQYPPPHVNHQSNIQVSNAHPHSTPPQQPHVQPPPQQIQHVIPPPHLHNTMPPQLVQQMQNMPPQVHQPMPMPPHVPIPNNPPPRPSSHTPPHQYQQGPPPRQGGPHGVPHTGPPPHGKPQMNGDIKSGPQQRQQRHQYQQQQMQERVGPQGHPQVQMAYQEVKQDSPHQMPPQQLPPQNMPQPRSQPPPHQQQRHDGPPTPQAQEGLKDLQAFSHDFKLASMPPHTSPTLPPVQHVPQGIPPQAPPHMSGAESPQLVPHMGPPPVQAHSAGTSPNSSSSNLSTINSSVADQSQSSGGSQKQPSPAQSPQSNEGEKLQNTVAKSKLNPNAKEFVWNPIAKPYQPRSPSTPSASRPHTPQTPSHSPYIAVSGPGGPQMPVMMPMHYMTISQPQYQPPPPQQNRIRKIPMGQIRTDMASQMQHAAAVTGQPLLAPAPIPAQFIYNPQAAAAAAAHNMNQAAYQPATMAAMHAIRMYDAAAAAAAPQQMSYITQPQPSGTPSPAQQYNQAVQQQQGPPQGYQTVPQQQPPPQMPMFCIPTQPHMLQNVPYLQQVPPPHHQQQHVQVLVQHPSQGNHHGPNP
ncbi:unnamed protein product [Ceutorhynchus assimilis]|uniref:LsmAD domain-containing protein n=1 Tax=Ceutorhynchus assimilis TaxID=467358 RepID=A0A9N9QL98_9CUCU|nr:unnamed protein product [Ceutorhynchus assimilis]